MLLLFILLVLLLLLLLLLLHSYHHTITYNHQYLFSPTIPFHTLHRPELQFKSSDPATPVTIELPVPPKCTSLGPISSLYQGDSHPSLL